MLLSPIIFWGFLINIAYSVPFTKKILTLADVRSMKIFSLLLLSTLLLSEHIYEKKTSVENRAAMNNKKIKCRWVCDIKVYKEQRIAEAISFYKSSKHYEFKSDGFSSF